MPIKVLGSISWEPIGTQGPPIILECISCSALAQVSLLNNPFSSNSPNFALKTNVWKIELSNSLTNQMENVIQCFEEALGQKTWPCGATKEN
jgi:hypothetical protein